MEQNNKDKHLAKRSGFTLIEIILVVVIIGILASIAIPRMSGHSKRAQETQAQSNIDALGMAIAQYEIINGDFPPSLDALLDESKGGPFMEKRAIPTDPWGNPFVYSVPGGHNTHSYDLYVQGHEEDLNNW